ncbi:hypothetical protein QN219_17770 [Sinorhizobium sp. 7-81]|uniref:hypothetical protein n=1 Tax=Sinorhizobium sp. 8-89 TaxID=3049089 RepID=UPI0024C46E83|nr:hypothetical protein [Sinorhizobium sp. 8-89]MDK1491891.1 hypothetical protein [Sinorhizobium sp. 8-89]
MATTEHLFNTHELRPVLHVVPQAVHNQLLVVGDLTNMLHQRSAGDNRQTFSISALEIA